mmetsp:Transcript_540/g.1420  ORF Transcript_540/g.1420 Transcript_540/m.1420 type:complete len:105 (+) Transcript_540:703-1017(+)
MVVPQVMADMEKAWLVGARKEVVAMVMAFEEEEAVSEQAPTVVAKETEKAAEVVTAATDAVHKGLHNEARIGQPQTLAWIHRKICTTARRNGPAHSIHPRIRVR